MIQKIKKRARGRPELPDHKRRSKFVHARMTADEKARLDRYLKERELSLTDLILKAIDKTS